MEQPAQHHKTNVDSDDEKRHNLSNLMLGNTTDAQEINELIDALRKIGYFKSFQTKEKHISGSDKDTKIPERKLKRRRKATYRKIKKYYKSIRQYKKERLRRKLCWLLSGKYTQTEIAEMLGCSRRTVIRDMNRIKPYYYRMTRSYLSKIEQQKIRELELKLEGKNPVQQLKILTDALIEQQNLMRQREYNRHVIKFYFDLDYVDPDGCPQLRMWPNHPANLTLPYILQFHFIKDGKPLSCYSEVTFDKMKTLSW